MKVWQKCYWHNAFQSEQMTKCHFFFVEGLVCQMENFSATLCKFPINISNLNKKKLADRNIFLKVVSDLNQPEKKGSCL